MVDIAWPVLLVVGAVCGVVATLVMDIPMRLLLPEGMTSPSVAAGALTSRPTAEAPRSVALAVHYGSGIGAGVIFATLTGIVSTVIGGQSLAGGLTVLAIVIAAVIQLPVMVSFFSYFVLPRFGTVSPERVPLIRRDWNIAALVYVIAVAFVLPLFVSAVA